MWDTVLTLQRVAQWNQVVRLSAKTAAHGGALHQHEQQLPTLKFLKETYRHRLMLIHQQEQQLTAVTKAFQESSASRAFLRPHPAAYSGMSNAGC